jgi:ribosomal protein L11 methyltransferase
MMTPERLLEDETPPDRWMVLCIDPGPDPDLRELLVDQLLSGTLLTSVGIDGVPRGVEERDAGLVVFLPPPEGVDTEALGARIQAELGAGGMESASVEVSWQPHEAWSELWRRGIHTRRVSPRVVVTPPWEPVEPAPGEAVVTIDPGMAFGTSEHPTTRGCIRLLDPRVEVGSRIVDVGAGSGILAIACAKLGAASVLALELDPWACTAARENAERNGVDERVRVRARAVNAEFLPGEEPFDGLVANIESGILLPLIPGFAHGVRAGGWMILSGILQSESHRILERANDVGFELTDEDREGEWWSAAFVLKS